MLTNTGTKDADAITTKDAGASLSEDAVTDGGTVCGYASTWDREPDTYGEVVTKGAFAESLAHWSQLNEDGRYIPLLFAHDRKDPKHNIGRVKLAREDERGLYIEAEFDPENEKAQYVRKLVKEGRLYQFSIGYRTRDVAEATIDGMYVRELRKLDLLEVSLVQVPANQHAEVTEVKDGDVQTKAGRRNSQKDEDALRGLLDQLDAMRNAVVALIGDDADEDADESDGGKADDTAPTKDDDASDTGEKSTEGDEGKAMSEGHEVDEFARVEAYKAAVLAGLVR